MARALVALFVAAFAFAASILALDLHRNFGGAVFVGAVLAGCGVVLGLPVLVLFCKYQWWQPWRFVVGGMLGGALFSLPFLDGRLSAVFVVVVLATAGMTAGIGLWLTGIWRNENLTCPREFCLPCGIAYKYARNALRRRQPSA